MVCLRAAAWPFMLAMCLGVVKGEAEEAVASYPILSASSAEGASWRAVRLARPNGETERAFLMLEPVVEKGKGPLTPLAGKNYYYPYYLGLLFNKQFPAQIPSVVLEAADIGDGLMLNGGWLAGLASGDENAGQSGFLAGIYPDGTASWNPQWPLPQERELASLADWVFPTEGKYDERLAALAVKAATQQKKAIRWSPVLLSAGAKGSPFSLEGGRMLALYQVSVPQDTSRKPGDELVRLAERMKKTRERLQAWEENSKGAWDDELLHTMRDTSNLARLALEAGMLPESGRMLDRLEQTLALIEGQDLQQSPPAWGDLQKKIQESYQELDRTYPDESKNGRDEAGYLKHFAAVDRFWSLHGELAGLEIMVAKGAEDPVRTEPEFDTNRRRYVDFRLRQIKAYLSAPATSPLEGRVPVRAENAALLRELSKLAVWDSAEGLFYTVLNDPNRDDVLRYDPTFHFVVNNTNLIKNGDFAYQLLSNDLRSRDETNREEIGFVPGNAFRPPEDFALVRDYEGKKSPLNPVLAIHFLVRQEVLRFKYEKLQPTFDPAVVRWTYGREDPLASRLVLSAGQAAEALDTLRQERELAACAALPDFYLRRGMLSAHASGTEQKLEALGDFWKSTLLSRTILALTREERPPAPQPEVQMAQAEDRKGPVPAPDAEEGGEPAAAPPVDTPPVPGQVYARPPRAIPVALPVDDAELVP